MGIQGAEMKVLALFCSLSIGIILNIQCKPSSEAVMVKTHNQIAKEIQVHQEVEVTNQDQASMNGKKSNSQESGEATVENQVQRNQKDFRKIVVTREEVMKFITAFTKVLTHTLLLTVGPVGHVFGIVTTILLYSDGMLGGKGTNSDLWSQLKERIQVEVGKGLAEYHFHQTRKFRLEIESKIALQDRLTVEHWNEIIARNKFDFFPQTNPATGYDARLCLLPVTWVTYMVAALGQLENLGKVPRCSVAKELKKVKEDLRQAAKEMFRKRYKAISGIKYWKNTPSCPFAMCHLTTWFYQMADGATDQTFVIKKMQVGSPSWSEYHKYRQNTVDMVWNTMIEKINAFFTADICREGCDCPTPILKYEISWGYFTNCYGKLDDKKYCNQCDTPCKMYGYSYTWCGCSGKHWTWDYCAAANWNICNGETPYPFQRAKEFQDSRRK